MSELLHVYFVYFWLRWTCLAAQAFWSSFGERGLLSSCIEVTPLAVEHGHWGAQASVAAAPRF